MRDCEERSDFALQVMSLLLTSSFLDPRFVRRVCFSCRRTRLCKDRVSKIVYVFVVCMATGVVFAGASFLSDCAPGSMGALYDKARVSKDSEGKNAAYCPHVAFETLIDHMNIVNELQGNNISWLGGNVRRQYSSPPQFLTS